MRWCCPSVCLSVRPVSLIGSEVLFVFQRRWLNALALSCLGDRQRGICLFQRRRLNALLLSVCLSVRLSVCPSVSLYVAKMRTLKRDFLKN